MDQLSATEASLLGLEDARGVHLHTGCALVFNGPLPGFAQFSEHVRSRLDLVPRYRRRVVSLPRYLGYGAWIDDPHFELGFHVRQAAPPDGADDAALARLIGALLSQRLDRGKPLWELWLIGPLDGERFAVLAKSHAALVDGARNVDLLSVLLGEQPAPQPARPAGVWDAAPPPTPAQLLVGALATRARDPRMPLRAIRAGLSAAIEALDLRNQGPLGSFGAPPPSPLNGTSGLQRRLAGVEVGLGRLRKERERLGGTVNDAVLTAVAGAVGRYLRLHGEDTGGLVLRALVPLADAASPRLLASYVPLPVGIADPRRRHAEISRTLDGLSASGRARPARELTDLAGFAPPTMLAQAARLQSAARDFNLVVTNIPGPRSPRYMLGGELRSILPAMPLARNQALSVALVSHRGRLHFGLLADDGVLGDVDTLAGLLKESVAELRKGGGRQRKAQRAPATDSAGTETPPSDAR
jgi:diacylglycerol O-acyltransferase